MFQVDRGEVSIHLTNTSLEISNSPWFYVRSTVLTRVTGSESSPTLNRNPVFTRRDSYSSTRRDT